MVDPEDYTNFRPFQSPMSVKQFHRYAPQIALVLLDRPNILARFLPYCCKDCIPRL
jgi:hypothetical protein